VIVKEVLSDLFELRNVVNLKKNSLQNNGNSWGVGGPQMTLWKGNSKGVRGKNLRTIRGGGVWRFSGTTQCMKVSKIVLM